MYRSSKTATTFIIPKDIFNITPIIDITKYSTMPNNTIHIMNNIALIQSNILSPLIIATLSLN